MEKKKLNFIMQISFIVVFAFVALGSGTTNKASEKRATAYNAVNSLLYDNGYREYCSTAYDYKGLRYFGLKKGNCKATICMHWNDNSNNSDVLVIFQNCEASSYLEDKINKIPNCTYYYNSSDFDYCSINRGETSTNGGTSTNSSSSSTSSSSSSCQYDYWWEPSGGFYCVKARKTCDRSLTITYKVHFSDGSSDQTRTLHIIGPFKEDKGIPYREKGRIEIVRVVWGD